MTCRADEEKPVEGDVIRRIRTVAAAILLGGFASSVLLYLTAERGVHDPFDEFEKSKKFAWELERVGGKAALAANDFNRWFAGLWQGETLAFTVAVITVITAAGYYVIASGLAAEQRERTR